MKKRHFPVIVITVLFILTVLLIGIILNLQGRVKTNPAGTVGNSAGNLYNGGLFCEHDGMVYFANPYDYNTLYAMDITEDNIRKLRNVSVQNLLAAGDHLYFFRTSTAHTSDNVFTTVGAPTALNRCRLDGSDSKSLKTGIVLSAQLVDNHLYMMLTDNKENILYKTDTNGSRETELTRQYIQPVSAENGVIYYSDPLEHSLTALDTSTDTATRVFSGNIWSPTKYGDYVYYIDADNDYSLNRYILSRKKAEILTTERVDFYNVGNGYIYYQTSGKEPCLKFMTTEGGSPTTLAVGAFRNIHLTSTYVYFRQYGVDDVLYHSYLGSGSYSEFSAAQAIVKE